MITLHWFCGIADAKATRTGEFLGTTKKGSGLWSPSSYAVRTLDPNAPNDRLGFPWGVSHHPGRICGRSDARALRARAQSSRFATVEDASHRKRVSHTKHDSTRPTEQPNRDWTNKGNEKGKMHENPKFCRHSLQINVPVTKSTFWSGQKHVQAGGAQNHNQSTCTVCQMTHNANIKCQTFLCRKSHGLRAWFAQHVPPSNSLCLSGLLWDRMRAVTDIVFAAQCVFNHFIFRIVRRACWLASSSFPTFQDHCLGSVLFPFGPRSACLCVLKTDSFAISSHMRKHRIRLTCQSSFCSSWRPGISSVCDRNVCVGDRLCCLLSDHWWSNDPHNRDPMDLIHGFIHLQVLEHCNINCWLVQQCHFVSLWQFFRRQWCFCYKQRCFMGMLFDWGQWLTSFVSVGRALSSKNVTLPETTLVKDEEAPASVIDGCIDELSAQEGKAWAWLSFVKPLASKDESHFSHSCTMFL